MNAVEQNAQQVAKFRLLTLLLLATGIGGVVAGVIGLVIGQSMVAAIGFLVGAIDLTMSYVFSRRLEAARSTQIV